MTHSTTGGEVTDPRVAIVTGAASGIGAATVRRLAADGWRVVGVDRRPPASLALPQGVQLLTGDAGDPAILDRALQAAARWRPDEPTPALHGLVCAAGIPPSGAWDDRESWDETMRVDLSAVAEALRRSLPALTAGRGAAVVVGSIVGSAEGSARSPAYAAAKSGLGGLVRSMALVGAPQGVRVNLVEPGAIDTPFDPPRFPADARPDVPLGRMGTADEVAGAIAFLLGPDAAYITGATLRVDGGRTILPPGG